METIHQPGEIISERYRIIDTLGRGGVGITYAAEDLQSGERVALKALSLRRMKNWKKMELFEREAKVISQLNHPDIPRYLDYFQTDSDGDRSFYIAQELAPGDSLAVLVENGWQQDETKVQLVAVRILAILVYLQSLTPPVIHRDIKPSNIIRSSDGQIFLVDFGAVVDSYRHTVAGGSTVVGTYGYMAPEQFRGQAALETDLYGLGATLVFLLTGKSPADLPRRQLKIDFRSSVRISQQFADWLEKMLEPAREDRFQSAEEALAVLQGERTFSRSVASKQDKPKGSPIILTRTEESLVVEIPPGWLRGNYHTPIALFPLIAIGFFGLSILWIFESLVGNSVVAFFLAACLCTSCLSLITFISQPLSQLIFGGLSRTRIYISRDGFRFERHLLGWNIHNSTDYLEGINLNSVGLPLFKRALNFLTMQLGSGQKYRFGLLLTLKENQWLIAEIATFIEELRSAGRTRKKLDNNRRFRLLNNLALKSFVYLFVIIFISIVVAKISPANLIVIFLSILSWLFAEDRKYYNSQEIDEKIDQETNQKTATEKQPGGTHLDSDSTTSHKETDQRTATEEQPGEIHPSLDLSKGYYQRGLHRFSVGDRQGAIEYYDRAISLNPNLAEAYHNRGIARSALGDKQKAIEDFDRATSLNPKVETYLYRGVARYVLSDNKGAIEDFSRAIVMNPNLAQAYQNRGMARCALGDNQTAIEDFNSAINLKPNRAEAYFYRGMARSILGDNRQAIKDYESAISLKPNWVEAYFYQGIAWSNYGDLNGAIENYDRAISFNSNWAHAYYKRGFTHYLLGNCDRAILDLTQAIELNPNFAAAYYNRGNARYDLGDEGGATEDYNLALELESADIDTSDEHGFYGRGLARSRLGKVEEARADLEEAARLCSDRRNMTLHEKIMAAIDKL